MSFLVIGTFPVPKYNLYSLWLIYSLPVPVTEQIEVDIQGEKNALEEAKAGITRLHKELGRLSDQVAAAEVCPTKSSIRQIVLGYTYGLFPIGATSQSRGKTSGRDGYSQPI